MSDNWSLYNESEYTVNGVTYRNLEAQVARNQELSLQAVNTANGVESKADQAIAAAEAAQATANEAETKADQAISAAEAAQATANNALPKSGGTMTGDLTLFENPSSDLMAATKQYVDDKITMIKTITNEDLGNPIDFPFSEIQYHLMKIYNGTEYPENYSEYLVLYAYQVFSIKSFVANLVFECPGTGILTFSPYGSGGTYTQAIPTFTKETNGIPEIEKTSSDTSVSILPNTFYTFPEMSAISITFSNPADNTIVNEYHFRFTSGSTATTLTLPSSVIGDITIEANKVYEISIIDNYLVYQSWAVSA